MAPARGARGQAVDGARQPPVTQEVVAALAQVHVSTVSRALDPARSAMVSRTTREKVLSAAAQLGYEPHLIASQLRRGRTHTVGVIVPDLANPLYAPFVRGVMHALDRNGYMPLVADTEDDHDRFARVLSHLASRRVDAVIAAAARAGDAKLLKDAANRGMPIILAIRTLAGIDLPLVRHDDVGGGGLAAEHLLDLGHRRLLQLKGPPDVKAFHDRDLGFTRIAAERGAVVLDLPHQAESPTAEEGARLIKEVLDCDGPLPTGIFAQNDLMALGALDALHAAGLRVPQDVSLVGYNDMLFATHASVALTTVRFPAYDIGRLAGTMAHQYIEEPGVSSASVSTSPTLVVRKSTGPAADR